MRKSLFLATLILAVSVTAFSQFTTLNPRGQIFGYQHNIVASRSYATNTVDTLPNTAINTWGNQTQANKTITINGAQTISFVHVGQDSATADVYFDTYDATANAYTQQYADSVKTTGAAQTEIVIVSSTVNRLAGIDKPVRIRVSYRNVTQGVSSATYIPRLKWKP